MTLLLVTHPPPLIQINCKQLYFLILLIIDKLNVGGILRWTKSLKKDKKKAQKGKLLKKRLKKGKKYSKNENVTQKSAKKKGVY